MKKLLRLFLISCLLGSALSSFAQSNVVYKDLFVLLNAKMYAKAEPFLKKYLKKNDKDANAYLFMGIIYQDKVFKTNDDLKATVYMDSALYNYNKALSYLNITALNTNSDYYQMYLRRDLLTGKTSIQYEDILTDISARKYALTNELLRSCRTTVDVQQNAIQKSPNKTNISARGKYVALVIGVSEYTNSKLNLVRPVIDAKNFSDLITTHYNFEPANVTLLLNPTRQQIMNALYGLRKIVGADDNLLLFYAGHGMYDEAAGQGYWWPSDADSNNPSNWLSNNDLRDQVRGIKSAHTLLIADACFSGGIFRTRGIEIKQAPLDVLSLYKLPSRRAITSGTMTTVPDESVFFNYLVKALNNNPDTYITSQSLFESFRMKVINNTLQLPQDGIISETGDEGGDFVFIRRN